MSENDPKPTHFQGKDAVEHVIEAQARGIVAKAEAHGEEIPGSVASFADTARETATLLTLLWAILYPLEIEQSKLILFAAVTLGWTIWRFGRSAWLGWSRLERLHRLVAEEKWEIDHHRDQEREELSALYEAKGFKGKLLEDVINVLMSDEDRLLRVMLEEELGLTLEKQDHPLQLGLGALIGALSSAALSLVGFALSPDYGLLAGAAVTITAASIITATYNRNRRVSAVVWNLGLLALAGGMSFYLKDFLQRIL
ncbi:MAG: VIT1/CCC1 transporter family protein [Chlamydiia bacterium]|nr:VIT1/CCC1 transporter family protein [Chlamydiia bacterium]